MSGKEVSLGSIGQTGMNVENQISVTYGCCSKVAYTHTSYELGAAIRIRNMTMWWSKGPKHTHTDRAFPRDDKLKLKTCTGAELCLRASIGSRDSGTQLFRPAIR